MSQKAMVRRVVLEALASGAPAHEVAAEVLKTAGSGPKPVVARALERLRGGDLHGGLALLGCDPPEIAAVVADPAASRRIEERLARVASWVGFAQQVGSLMLYGASLLIAGVAVSGVSALLERDLTGREGEPAVGLALAAALGLVVVQVLVLRKPWKTHRTWRAVAVAVATAGPEGAPHLAAIDKASGGLVTDAAGHLEGLRAATLEQLEASLAVRWKRETTLSTEAMRVLGLAFGGLPGIWILLQTYGLVGGLAGGAP